MNFLFVFHTFKKNVIYQQYRTIDLFFKVLTKERDNDQFDNQVYI